MIDNFLPLAETRAATQTLIQLMHRLFAEEGPPATGWGGEGFARQLRGPTFAGSCMDSPSVPPPHHLHLLPQLTHVPASNKCSE